MIATFGSAMDLLLSVCAVILTIGVLIPAIKIFRGWSKSDEEEKQVLQKEFYLAFSGIVIILVIRLFLLPIYFWAMQGFVPMIPGAMCLWGVFTAVPAAWGALLLKFALPVVYVGWIFLYYIDGKSKTHPLMRNMMAFFIIISPLVLIDSGTDLLVFGQISPIHVNCCSDAIDLGMRPVPGSIGALSGQMQLLIIFFLVGSLFAFSLFLSIKHRAANWVALALSLPLAGIYVLNMTEVLAPWLLHLPFHHCPFCLLQDHPLSIAFSLLIWFGVAAPWLMLITSAMGHETLETQQTESKVKNAILKAAALSILIALVLIAVDIFVSFA